MGNCIDNCFKAQEQLEEDKPINNQQNKNTHQVLGSQRIMMSVDLDLYKQSNCALESNSQLNKYLQNELKHSSALKANDIQHVKYSPNKRDHGNSKGNNSNDSSSLSQIPVAESTYISSKSQTYDHQAENCLGQDFDKITNRSVVINDQDCDEQKQVEKIQNSQLQIEQSSNSTNGQNQIKIEYNDDQEDSTDNSSIENPFDIDLRVREKSVPNNYPCPDNRQSKRRLSYKGIDTIRQLKRQQTQEQIQDTHWLFINKYSFP